MVEVFQDWENHMRHMCSHREVACPNGCQVSGITQRDLKVSYESVVISLSLNDEMMRQDITRYNFQFMKI